MKTKKLHLFFFLNICFHLTQSIKNKTQIINIKQKTNHKKKYNKKKTDGKKEKTIELKQNLKEKLIEKFLFSKKKVFFSKNEIFHNLIFQLCIILGVFFISGINFSLCLIEYDKAYSFFLFFWFSIFLFFIFFLEVVYFFSRCNMLTHSNSQLTAFYFISFVIIITNFIINSSLYKRLSQSDSLIEKLMVFKPFTGYYQLPQEIAKRNQRNDWAREQNRIQTTIIDRLQVSFYIDEGFFLEQTIVLVRNDLSYSLQGLLVFITFFLGFFFEIYFLLKEKKTNQFWLIIPDGCFCFLFFFSAFVYRGVRPQRSFWLLEALGIS